MRGEKFMFKKISYLILSFIVVIIIVSCGRSSNAPIQVDSSKKEIKLNYKYEKFDDYSNYKIYAEKPGFVFIKKYSGELVWTPIMKGIKYPNVKTNQYGWCEITSNKIPVYINANIDSDIIDYLFEDSYVTIVQYMKYFTKVLTPSLKEGWIENKYLKNYTGVPEITGDPIKIEETSNYLNITMNQKKLKLKKHESKTLDIVNINLLRYNLLDMITDKQYKKRFGYLDSIKTNQKFSLDVYYFKKNSKHYLLLQKSINFSSFNDEYYEAHTVTLYNNKSEIIKRFLGFFRWVKISNDEKYFSIEGSINSLPDANFFIFDMNGNLIRKFNLEKMNLRAPGTSRNFKYISFFTSGDKKYYLVYKLFKKDYILKYNAGKTKYPYMIQNNGTTIFKDNITKKIYYIDLSGKLLKEEPLND